MECTFKAVYDRKWVDEFMCICYMQNMTPRVFTLSKRKILGFLSELPTLTKPHILMLDTLSSINRLTYNMTDNSFTIYLNTLENSVTVRMPEQNFTDILICCTVKQHKSI